MNNNNNTLLIDPCNHTVLSFYIAASWYLIYTKVSGFPLLSGVPFFLNPSLASNNEITLTTVRTFYSTVNFFPPRETYSRNALHLGEIRYVQDLD